MKLKSDLYRIGRVTDGLQSKSLGSLRARFEASDPNFKKRAHASVCLLFRGESFEASEVLLIERSHNVSTHAGQVAFPGGAIEPGDRNDPIFAALRECREEVGILEDWIDPHAVLEPYPTFTGGFLVHPVLASFKISAPADGGPLLLDPSEVAAASFVKVSALIETRRIEERSLFDEVIRTPYFMWGDRKMWGLSAWIFDSILNRYATIKA